MRFDAETLALLRRSADPDAAVYLVGGALRDALLERPFTDLDLASPAARPTASRLAKAFGGRLVVLDDKNAVFRVVLGEKFKRIRQIDVAAIQGRDILQDIERRDFTLNAMALALSADLTAEIPVSRLIDPRKGFADIQKRLLRAESEALFKDDPLRCLRAFRIAAQLGFKIEPKTLQMIRRNRNRVRLPAGERVQAELMALLRLPGCSSWVRLMDECELLTALFEDLEPARRCATVYYGEGGVLTHSLDTVARADFMLDHLPDAFPGIAGKIKSYLAEKSGAGSSHRALLILAALLHDVAKASTAKTMGGRLRFFGHDVLGAKMASAVLRALRFSKEQIETVSAVIANHLRPGNLAAGGKITDKAVYRFFRDIGPHTVSLLLVCWADHASYLTEKNLALTLKETVKDPDADDLARLRPDARKTVHHLRVIGRLLRGHFDTPEKTAPQRLVDGNDVMKILRLPPGPEIGRWLDKIRERQAEGKIADRKQALLYLSRAKSK